MAGGFRILPRRARPIDGVVVVAVEDQHDAVVAGGIGRHCAVRHEADRRAVGIVVPRGEPDRLRLRLPVLRRAVRQEGFVAVGPEMRVDRLAPLLGAELHDRPPPARHAFLEQLRQHAFERLPVEVVEQDLGHVAPPRHARREECMMCTTHSVPFRTR